MNSSKDIIRFKRYEKKWIIKNLDTISFFLAIHRSDFKFSETYENRNINSIYFDNKEFFSIAQNFNGDFFKKKYRLRWYGDSKYIKNPQFEIKIKYGQTTYKEVFLLKLNKALYFSNKNLEVINDLIKQKFKFQFNIIPVLATHYKRYYFSSANKNIRATFDENISCTHIYGYNEMVFRKVIENKIFELKYDSKHDNLVKSKLKNISAILSKNSKYITCAFEPGNFFSA